MSFFTRALLCVVCVTLAISIYGCGGGSTTAPVANSLGEVTPVVEDSAVIWPAGLPVDAAQPWEELDSDGRVSSCLNGDSEFLAGCEHFYDCASGITDTGETVCIASGEPGSGLIAWTMYRVVMGGEQPGVVAADVNPGEMSDGALSEYYIGLSDYGDGCWNWHGPFTDNHVRISTGADIAAGADYLSELGNHFVCIVAHDGATVDVVGVATNSYDATDIDAPPVPLGLYVTPANGALDVQWDDVIAGDLAGYRLYWSEADFTTADEGGVHCIDYLIGQASYLLKGLPATTIRVRVSAVDISGNESALSDMESVLVYEGSGPDLRIGVSSASGMINDAITLTASGADEYAWDLDGDGIYEVTGDTTGTQTADTGRTGIIRPAVRGTTGGGSCVACGAVSLVIAGNSRPVASALAAPATGIAPLLVTLTGTGLDDDGILVSYSWDFDGDGTYDQTDTSDPGPVQHSYTTTGMYNAKFRVEDDLGSWDVDTVAILVNEPAVVNNPPVADLAIGTGEESGDAPHSVHFDASGSTDPDGAEDIVRYWWDLDGDGGYELTTDAAGYNYTYQNPGVYSAKVKVEDADGDSSTDTVEITVSVVGNDDPVADLTSDVSSGDAPLDVHFDATGSTDSDGTIVLYEWDFERDGIYDGYGTVPTADHTYTEAGTYNCRVRVTDDAGAQDTNSVEISVNVPGNDYPVADLTSDVTSGDIPLTVSFDASGSTDGDGSITRYEWDFDGDGNYDGYGIDPTIDHTYTTAGVYICRVCVTDDAGAQDTDTVEITASVPGNDDPVADLAPATDSGDAPYTVSFDASGSSDTDGTIVLYEWDFDGNGAYDSYGDDPTIDHTYGAGSYTAKLRVTDDAGAQDTATATIDVNAPPVANLVASSYQVDFDEEFWLFAENSTDSDGSIVDYEWDLDNNGTYNESGNETDARGLANVQYSYSRGGYYRVHVRVTDDDGGQDITDTIIYIPGWGFQNVDLTDDVGNYTSMDIIDGRPAISYYDDTNNELNYVRSLDANGREWGVPQVIDSAGDVGQYTSLETVDGLPAISYYDADNGDLKYVRAMDARGDSWGTPQTVVSNNDAGSYTDLLVVDGQPAIGYIQDRGYYMGNLWYVRATDATGSSWGTPVSIDTGNADEMHDLLVVDGNPAICYYRGGVYDLMYVRADDATGVTWGSPVTVAASGNAGMSSSMAIVDGRPAVGYHVIGESEVYYRIADDAIGSSWGAAVTVDSGCPMRSVQLAVVGGLPAMAFHDNNTRKLKYVQATDATGTTWGTITTVDSTTYSGEWSDLLEINGRPSIAYYKSSSGNLRYARLY